MLRTEEGQSFFDAALARLPIPVVISRRSDHVIVQANDALAAYLRRPLDALIGTKVDDFVNASVELDFSEVRHGALVFDNEHLRGDGSRVPGRVHMLTLPGSNELVMAAIVDTSEFHLARRRWAIVLELTSLLVRGSRLQLDEVTEAAETLLAEHLGGAASIVWHDDPPHGAPADITRSVQHAIRVDDRLVGTVTLGDDGDDGMLSEAFVEVVVAYLGALHVVTTLRERLHASELLELAFDSTLIGMQLISDTNEIIRANQAFADMVGRSIEEVEGTSWRDYVHPAELAGLEGVARAHASGETTSSRSEVKFVTADGRVVHADSTSATIANAPGSPYGASTTVAQVIDVTERVEALEREERLRHELEVSERRYRSLVEPAVDLIARLAVDGSIADANPSFATSVGVERDLLVGENIVKVLPARPAEVVRERLASVAASRVRSDLWREWIELERDSGWYVIRLIPEISADDEPVEFVYLVASEITELVENEQRLAALALVDPLTGVSNRAAVLDRLAHAIDRLDRRRSGGVAVAVIDLDHFKALNDAYGHAVGDEALHLTAESLRKVVRAEDTVGRLGGDEFIVVLEDIADVATASELGERIRSVFTDLVVVLPEGFKRRISGSVGVSYTDHAVPREDLLARADRAMYLAKTHGRGRTWVERYDAGDDEVPARSSGALLRDLAGAVGRNQFVLHYQPIARPDDLEIVGFEALLRWQHPTMGLLAPGRFLEPLMSTGQIGPVGRWVLRAAIRQLAEWQHDERTAGLHLNVNVSPTELAALGFSQFMREVLDDHDVDPQLLRLELTEQSLAGTVVSTSALSEIAAVGPKLVLDDFGTGVSSLSHLRLQPLHGIKIDRSFVRSVIMDEREMAITHSVLQLAASLGLEVTAEGVEGPEQLRWLAEVGCPLVQGYHLGFPMPVDDAVALLPRR